jgi:hypothetical protein
MAGPPTMGKPYLNFNAELNDDVKKNTSEIFGKAEKNWPTLNK